MSVPTLQSICVRDILSRNKHTAYLDHPVFKILLEDLLERSALRERVHQFARAIGNNPTDARGQVVGYSELINRMCDMHIYTFL